MSGDPNSVDAARARIMADRANFRAGILDALAGGARTVRQIADALGLPRHYRSGRLQKALVQLRNEGLIHLSAVRPGPSGIPNNLWALRSADDDE